VSAIYITSYRARVALSVLLFAVAAASGPAAAGGIYRYVDPDGVVHYTNQPRDSRYVRIEPLPRLGRERTRVPTNGGYDGLIQLAARQHDVPPALVKAVIAAESLFDPSAVSHKGAQGLMQLMPATAAELGVRDPLRADDNVRGGTRYLRAMLDRYGDMTQAIAAYNAGPTAVDRYRGVPPYPETRDYVQRVMTYYRQYDGDFGR
jgi:soluble lytic murein transglycosylase-like protein